MKKLFAGLLVFLLVLVANPVFAMGSLTDTWAELDDNISGAATNVSFGFTTEGVWDADGYLTVTFDYRFGLSGVTKVESSKIDGGLTFQKDDNLLYIWRDGTGSDLAAGTIVDDLTIYGVVNPIVDDETVTNFDLDLFDENEIEIEIGTASGPFISKWSAGVNAPRYLTLTSLNSGEVLTGGDDAVIAWDGNDITSVRLKLSRDGGSTYSEVIADDVDISGEYFWSVPNEDLSSLKIKVEGLDEYGNVVIEDISNANFSVSVVEEFDYEAYCEDGADECEPVVADSDTAEGVPSPCAIGLVNWVDGSLITGSGSSAVYYVYGNTRLSFPNEAIFYSWYEDFDDVIMVPECSLWQLSLGQRVLMKPGSLIKINSDPKVYAVGPDGSKRHVDSEETAAALFGPDWAQTVVDIDVTQYFDYTDSVALTIDDTYWLSSVLELINSISDVMGYISGYTLEV